MCNMYQPTVIILLIFSTSLLHFGESIRCSVCDTGVGVSCLTHPPSASECGSGHEYCINVAKYTNEGKLMSLRRSCSPFQSHPACMPGLDRASNDVIQLCYSTCDKSGCNGSRSVHHLLDLLRRRRRK